MPPSAFSVSVHDVPSGPFMPFVPFIPLVPLVPFVPCTVTCPSVQWMVAAPSWLSVTEQDVPFSVVRGAVAARAARGERGGQRGARNRVHAIDWRSS